MKILVEDTKLSLLIETKKEFIGNRAAWDSVLSAVSFLISVFMASYNAFVIFPGIILKTLFVILGLIFTGKSIYDVYDSKKNSYTHEDLYTDIAMLNEITHNHSIIAIKDTFQEFPNRFLLYYDQAWSCYFFPNFKENINNESFIIEGLSNQLKVKRDDISIKYLAQEIHHKFSERHKEDRCYSHRLFEVKLASFSEKIKADCFEIDGIEYRWMSIAEMEQDTTIMEKNADLVGFVKANCN